MLRIGSIFIALASWTVSTIAFIPLLPAEAWAADCSQWDIGGHWEFRQSNGIKVYFDLEQTGSAISGSGVYGVRGDRNYGGPVTGSINGNGNIQLTTSWGGEYKGGVGSDAFIGGTTSSAGQKTVVTWRGNRAATCQPKPVKKLGKQLPGTSTTSDIPEKPVKKLGKRLPGTSKTSDTPQHQVAKANDDVDIYKGPGGEFGAYRCGPINCFMNKDETANVLWSKNGWYQVQTNKVPGGSGWVAEDHLTVTTH